MYETEVAKFDAPPEKRNLPLWFSVIGLLLIVVGLAIAVGILAARTCTSTTLPPTSEFTSGVCTLMPTVATPSTITGVLTFGPNSGGGVFIRGTLSGLVAGSTHAIHLHQYGNLSDPASASTGGHYNPAGVPHACPSDPRHAGDWGSVTADAQGMVTVSAVVPAPYSMTNVVGRAVVLHALPDDCVTQPSGNAGARVAHCVVGGV